MAIPINPYVAGNPVGDSPAFVGWADVLRQHWAASYIVATTR